MRKRWLWIGVVVLALALVSGTVVYAQTSDGFDLTHRSTLGADVGGKFMTSPSFRLVTGMGGLQETNMTSTNFKLCSGYVCDAGNPIPRLHLPLLEADPE